MSSFHLLRERKPDGDPEYLRPHPLDQAVRAAERLRQQPGWESRGDMTLGTIRVALNDVPGAADSFRRVLDRDPKEIDKSA